MSEPLKQCFVPGCGKLSLPGLLKGVCRYHYNVGQFGQAWADHVEQTDAQPVDATPVTTPSEIAQG